MRALLVALLLMPPLAAAADAPATLPPAGEGGEREGWTWTMMDARGLALGGGGLDDDDLEAMHALGFRAILNYREEMPDNETLARALGLEYLYLPTSHAESTTIPLAEVERAVAFIEENLAAGRPVYVHCNAGNFRGAIGVIAYFMKTNGWRYEEALRHARELRPDVEGRFADALYRYEAHLRNEKALAVDMWTDRWDVVPAETVNVSVRVTHHGAPVAGADVALRADYTPTERLGITDADGLVNLSIPIDAQDGLQYVHARASAPGFVPGYDRSQFWIGKVHHRGPTRLTVDDPPDAVAPGSVVKIPVRVIEDGKETTNARVTVTSECATFHRAYTGWDGKADVNFDAPTLPGTYPLRVVATRFNAQPVETGVLLVVGAGGPQPPCEPLPASSTPMPSAQGADAAAAIPLPLVATLAAVFAAATVRSRVRKEP